ncbi:MAG: thermonuclease family protein [Chloroflexota bacterium]
MSASGDRNEPIEPTTTFLLDDGDATAQPGWWQRRSRRGKGATIGGATLVLLIGIGNVTGGGQDAPPPTDTPSTAAVAEATAKPTPRPTPGPTAIPTPELGRAPAGTTTIGQVVDVVDGDTIKVEINGGVFTVRYIGIDTPETVHPTVPVEWMGAEASMANTLLVEGQEVWLEKDISEVDQYGRLLRYVWLQQGTDWLLVNYELVRLGFANSSTYAPDVLYQELFLEAEGEARGAGSGLWGETPTPAPTPPPTPVPTAVPVAPAVTPAPPAATPAPANCHTSYLDACLLVGVEDYDCAGGSGNGPYYTGRVRVVGPDEYGLDADGDGIGCE